MIAVWESNIIISYLLDISLKNAQADAAFFKLLGKLFHET